MRARCTPADGRIRDGWLMAEPDASDSVQLQWEDGGISEPVRVADLARVPQRELGAHYARRLATFDENGLSAIAGEWESGNFEIAATITANTATGEGICGPSGKPFRLLVISYQDHHTLS